MSRIDITLTTPTHPEFNWLDSFESLKGEEIEGIILILRGALAAFSAELSDRREPSTDRALEDYKKKLQKIAKQINKQGLTETHEGDLDSLKISLAQAGSAQVEREESQPSKAGRQYLRFISNVIGWPYALLIFCALGKHKVERINEVQRVKLLKYVAEHRKLLFCRILEDRAVQFRCQEKHIKVDLPLTRGSKKRKRREITDDAVNTEAKDQQSARLAAVVTDERAILKNVSPSALERSVSDPVIFSKKQAEPQNQVAAFSGPLEGFHDLPHDINLSLPNESILKDAGSRPPICEDGKHNFDGEFRTKPATDLSASNTKARTLPDAGTLSIISNVTPGSGGTIDNSGQIESAINAEHPESLANNSRSNSVVCFNQQLAQPVVATTAGTNTVVSGLDTEEVDSSPARDTRSSSFQSDSFASTPSITESQQSLTLNRINYEVVEQLVASAPDLNRSYNLQPGTNQLEQGMSSRLLMRERQQQSGECIPDFTQDAGLIPTASISAAPFADNEFVSPPNCNNVQGFFSDPSRMMHSPSPPQFLLVAEELFYNIKVYFEDSCQNMIFDDHGTLLNPNGAELHNDLCNKFDSYCFTATMFKGRELHVEFRHVLSKASALVELILRAEHPRTLACFLEVFIHLIQTGLPDVASILRDFIKKMSEKVTRGGHPWGQICRLLGELDSEPLDQAMAQIWKCTTNTFESELGASSRLAVSVRLDYIKRVYGFKEYLEEERLLRDLLAQFDGIPRVPTPRVMLNLAHNLNRQGRHDEAEKMAVEVFSLLQQNEIYAKRIAERIECMKTVSHSQFSQGKALVAERTIREAIQMIVDQWGIQHSWVLEFMSVLEGWLQDWGREEDANTLRGEIEGLMGKDEIDEQLDGIQGLLIHPAGRN